MRGEDLRTHGAEFAFVAHNKKGQYVPCSDIRAFSSTIALLRRVTRVMNVDMKSFSIDADNNIIAHADVPADAASLETFATAKELAKLSAEWPASRLVEVWNSFAGVTPFDTFRPVKKFTNRQTAVARIWNAIQNLGGAEPETTINAPEPIAAKKERTATKPAKAAKKTETPASERTNKRAEVLTLMKRAKGATLAEIMEATGWQAHTVRGFVSILASKHGEKIESAKNATGERFYKIAK